MNSRSRRVTQSIHLSLGVTLGLWVVLMALSGSVLLYKNTILSWQYPVLDTVEPVSIQGAAALLDTLEQQSIAYARLSDSNVPWVEVVDDTGAHHYYNAEKAILVRGDHQDFIGITTALHHELLLGDTGKTLLGIGGLLSLVQVISGLMRWWPGKRLSWRHFKIHWYRPTGRRGLQTLRELHQVSGVILFIPILLLLFTGTAIIYAKEVNASLTFLLPWQKEKTLVAPPLNNAHSWEEKFQVASTQFRDATPRIVYPKTGKMRLRHQDEWHPNGRNYLEFSSSTGQLTSRIDVRETPLGNQLSHTFYPLHAASVGGNSYRILVTLCGIVLILLPITGILYWLKRRSKAVKK